MYYLNTKILSTLAFSILTTGAIARDPVVYGKDNRIETYETRSPLYLRLANSTAARVEWSKITLSGNNAFLEGPTVASAENLCPEVRFSQQNQVANCSGVLVAPNVILTAGHCLMSHDACNDYAWVFNFKLRNARQNSVAVRERDVYRCKEILAWEMVDGKDYALARLDRVVVNAQPVKVYPYKPAIGTKVVTIGNPTGLPQKIADGAVVKSISHTEFRANLDTFEKGSGSPVFNALTGDLLGVLVRGEKDFIPHKNKSCKVINFISDDSPGEEMSSTTQFNKHIKKILSRSGR